MTEYCVIENNWWCHISLKNGSKRYFKKKKKWSWHFCFEWRSQFTRMPQPVSAASWMAWFQFKNGTTVRKWSLIFVGTQEMSRVSSWQYLGQCWITFTISYENLWTTYSTSASRVIVLKLFWYYTLHLTARWHDKHVSTYQDLHRSGDFNSSSGSNTNSITYKGIL